MFVDGCAELTNGHDGRQRTKNIYDDVSRHLQMHINDWPRYEYQPGVILIHCLILNGASDMPYRCINGLHVLHEMKWKHPKWHKVLTETAIDWSEYGSGHGRLSSLRRKTEGGARRQSQLLIDARAADEWYVAMHQFVRMLYAAAVAYNYNRNSGEFNFRSNDWNRHSISCLS